MMCDWYEIEQIRNRFAIGQIRSRTNQDWCAQSGYSNGAWISRSIKWTSWIRKGNQVSLLTSSLFTTKKRKRIHSLERTHSKWCERRLGTTNNPNVKSVRTSLRRSPAVAKSAVVKRLCTHWTDDSCQVDRHFLFPTSRSFQLLPPLFSEAIDDGVCVG